MFSNRFAFQVTMSPQARFGVSRQTFSLLLIIQTASNSPNT
jgi:hypothetical protein